jgi:hypothetical protein
MPDMRAGCPRPEFLNRPSDVRIGNSNFHFSNLEWHFGNSEWHFGCFERRYGHFTFCRGDFSDSFRANEASRKAKNPVPRLELDFSAPIIGFR